MPKHIIEDPNFEGWDGKFVDNSVIAPPNQYNYILLGRYMRENKKNFEDLSKDEILQFKLD